MPRLINSILKLEAPCKINFIVQIRGTYNLKNITKVVSQMHLKNKFALKYKEDKIMNNSDIFRLFLRLCFLILLG